MIVGLNGRSDVCKTVGALALVGLGYTQASFTEPLRDMLIQLDPRLGVTGLSGAPIYRSLAPLVVDKGWEHALQHPVYRDEIRRLLVQLGRAVRRTHGEDVLIRMLEKRLAASTSCVGGVTPTDADIVITDVRMPREAEWVVARGGIVIEVTRTGPQPVIDDRTEQPLPAQLIHRTLLHSGDDSQFAALLVDAVETANPAPVDTAVSA